jgi:hypothetical protein
MKAAQKYLFAGAAAFALLLSGCAGDYWVSAPYEGPGYGAYYGYHHFYGRSLGARHLEGSPAICRRVCSLADLHRPKGENRPAQAAFAALRRALILRLVAAT